jgi:ATP-dependent DNA ligase
MSLPRGFVPPCLPTRAPQPPSGNAWLHEIKHDGFRVIAHRDGDSIGSRSLRLAIGSRLSKVRGG